MFDTLIVFLKEVFEKVNFEKVMKTPVLIWIQTVFDTLIGFLKEIFEKVNF